MVAGEDGDPQERVFLQSESGESRQRWAKWWESGRVLGDLGLYQEAVPVERRWGRRSSSCKQAALRQRVNLERHGGKSRRTLGPHQEVESPGNGKGWKEGLLKAGCYSAESESREIIREERKGNENHLLNPYPGSKSYCSQFI